ncbi:MAG TPA: septation protein SepH [Nocardioidaceae bacterium]|nr:septation protein SepH [Nocardioidaceae bacterium]
MRDLRLVGLSEDRKFLILRDEAGDECRVPADERLRAALRGDRARLGQLEIQMESVLRPRDIQARIRAGESPEDVAAVAQVPIEKIMGYAVPVLAEREHIAERARRSGVRRKHADGPASLLGDAVDEQLRRRGSKPHEATWDSWRRDDGRWAVTVAPAGGGRTARYIFDVPGRFVVADDEAARALVGDHPEPPDPTEMAIASAVAEAELNEPLPRVAYREDDETAASVTPLHRPRPARPVAASEPLPLDEDDDSEPTIDLSDEADRAVGDDEIDVIARATNESGGTGVRRPNRRRRDRRRTSVPSWDEIMLGGKPHDE